MAQKFLTDIEVTRGLVDSSGDLGAAGQVLSSTGSGTNWITNEANSTVVYLDEFTGDNSTVDFTLSVSVTDENITQVYIDGVYQNKDTYSVSGTTLTFSTAPPLNADIEVITFSTATTSDDLAAGSVIIPVKNTHTASIAKGEPVYITGNVGSSARLQIAPADASNSAKMPAAGLLLQTLAVNAEGYVITGGYLRNITTDTIDGTSTSSNDTVYVKSGGGLTMTKPTGTNLIQNIAKVARVASGSAGSLLVSSILRTNDVPNITNDYFWLGNSSGVATPTEFTSSVRGLISTSGNAISYNSSTGVITSNYEESPTFTGNVTISGNLTVDGTQTILNTQTVEVEDNILQLNTTQGSPDTATATTSGISIYRGDGVTQASFIFDDADDTWDLTNNLVVAGNITASGGTLNLGNDVSIFDDGVNILRTDDAFHANNNIYIGGGGRIYDRSNNATYIQLAHPNMTFTTPSGTATFTGRVDIQDDLRIRGAGGNPSQGIVRFYTDSTNKLNIDTGNTGTNLTTIDSSGNATFAGYVGIGTSLPSTILHTSGSSTTLYNAASVGGQDTSATFRIQNVNTSANTFASIDFNTNNNRVVNRIVSSHGSSTSNGFLAFVTEGSGTPAERMRIDSSGNVGIGETSPSYKLEVKGSGTNTLQRWTTTEGGALLLIPSNDAANPDWTFISGTNEDIQIDPANNDSGLIVKYNGNVGIGTADPSRPLHIYDASDNPLRVESTDDTTGILFADSTTSNSLFYRGNGDYFYTTAKLGIGTTSPIGKTDIFVGASGYTNNITTLPVGTWSFANGSGGNSYPTLVSKSNATGAGMTLVGATDDGAPNGMDFNIRKGDNTDFSTLTTSGFTFSRFGTTLMTILRNGKVGIGTTLPDAPLEIQNIPAQQSQKMMLHLDANHTGNQGSAYMQISAGSNSQAATRIEQVSSGGSGLFGTYLDTNIINQGQSASAHGNINFVTNQAIRMTIGAGPNAGNVGIGTASPATVLDVRGSGVAFPATTGTTPSTGTRFRVASTGSASAVLDFGISTGGKSWLQVTDRIDLSIEYPFLINPNGGNVGIGTDSPDAKLDINGATYVRNVIYGYAGSGNQYGGLSWGGTDEGFLFLKDSNVTKVNINSNGNSYLNGGNVGIGTTSPGTALAFGGFGSIWVNNDASNPFGMDTVGGELRLFVGAASNAYQIKFGRYNGSNFDTSMVIGDDGSNPGYVGVGILSPQALLHVHAPDTTYTNYGTVFLGTTAGGSTGESGISLMTAGDALAGFVGSNFTINGSTYSQTNASRSSGYINFVNTTVAGRTSFINFGGTVKGSATLVERMRISDNGNVGINTTSPDGRLDVRGAISSGMALEDENVSLTSTGGTPQATGTLEISQGWSASTSNGDSIVFRHNSTSWKAWVLHYSFASTNGITVGVIGGYWNNSGSSSNNFIENNLGASVAVTHGGTGNQNIIVTFTFTALGTHPLSSFKYIQHGGDGKPLASKTSITLNS